MITVTAAADGTARFRFHLRGVPEGPRDLALKIVSLLPEGTTADITPHGDLSHASDSSLDLVDGVTRTITVASGWYEYAFPANADIPVNVVLDLGSASPGRYSTTLDQWDGASHLGRITFVVVVKPPS